MEQKVVVVTGAAQGIGRALAIDFAKQGYQVVATDALYAEYEQSNIHFIQANLKSATQMQKVFEEARHTFGGVHVLINNGAISKFHKSIQTIAIFEFEEVIQVNLTGSFICAKAFIEANQGLPFGRIINISSTRWNQNEAHWEAYGASKGAMVSLTNSLCVSLGNTPITVNAISPGWIEVNHYETLSSSDHQQHPSKRVGHAQDITRVALFLADEASDFINGANIVVDGGMSKKMIYQTSDNFWENEV
ncbi:MAG: SDR family NAD(P)-dependent oxidoreductase [Erysipelotrichaceae bacterium]